MIFVTVGTHEQQFNRLIKVVDRLKVAGHIKDEVVIQTGYSTYEPNHCKWSKLFSYKEMTENITKARIVITHGGPASFIAPLQIGKIPVVVPRQSEFGEHVNNHQAEFVKAVSERMGTIIPVFEIADLEVTIRDYDKIVAKMKSGAESNNRAFNEEFSKLVDLLIVGGKPIWY